MIDKSKFPLFGATNKIDNEKMIKISMEMAQVGMEFDRKLKEVAKKYNKENPGETSEALMAIFLTIINSFAEDGQSIHLLIEMLHKQHMVDALQKAMPIEDVKEFLKHMDIKHMDKEDEKLDMESFFRGLKDKQSKPDDRPNYLG